MEKKIVNMNTYVHDIMLTENDMYKISTPISSGFQNLDAKCLLYPGLYVLGGTSSLGKTTLATQLGDQIAEGGEQVLFFPLEQTISEIASKSLSRILYKNDKNPVSSIDIRLGKCRAEELSFAKKEYCKYASRIHICDCSLSTSFKEIKEVVDSFITRTKTKPVVIVDYLQAVQGCNDKHTTAKDLVDYNVRAFKELQAQYGIVLLLISSFNRQNYNTSVDYSSFKESGGIEYTADVLWGLQLQVISNNDYQGANEEKKKEMITISKEASTRKVELVCLKNRFGKSNYRCIFDYFPASDIFYDLPGGE